MGQAFQPAVISVVKSAGWKACPTQIFKAELLRRRHWPHTSSPSLEMAVRSLRRIVVKDIGNAGSMEAAPLKGYQNSAGLRDYGYVFPGTGGRKPSPLAAIRGKERAGVAGLPRIEAGSEVPLIRGI